MFVYFFTEQGKIGKTEIYNRNKFIENHATKVTKIQKNKVTKMK